MTIQIQILTTCMKKKPLKRWRKVILVHWFGISIEERNNFFFNRFQNSLYFKFYRLLIQILNWKIMFITQTKGTCFFINFFRICTSIRLKHRVESVSKHRLEKRLFTWNREQSSDSSSISQSSNNRFCWSSVQLMNALKSMPSFRFCMRSANGEVVCGMKSSIETASSSLSTARLPSSVIAKLAVGISHN